MAYASPLFAPTTFRATKPRFSRLSSKPKTTRTVTVASITSLSTASATDLSLFDGPTLAVIGGGSVAALAAALSLTDPERRRRLQAEEVGAAIRRLGHSKTVENVLKMLKDKGSLEGVTVCDAGCGTGSLAIPLAKEGAIVSASDISAAMVAEAEKQAKEQLLAVGENAAPVLPKFEVKDLESLDGKYETVVCLDVLIHYPQSKADGMIAHLASLAENRLILSFAPRTFYYDLLKRVGELFPGPSKATRAYLHAEADVERALKKVGWRIRKRGLITTQFYFARLVEAVQHKRKRG
ncbi:hypothetical protein GH714_040496 [Hevea brasiliensis]|uniref:Magnesium-protoporphyrin IX methyltransferase C-terminal domain-containing protein n=1 Tax=Hevea brasiliensis TaxID=3981 RepID=A0A6A6MKA0_HEVBR|nr:hypothetical protein GH714_040496 [Hevea brasiliensis]